MKQITLCLTFILIIMLLSLTACNYSMPNLLQNDLNKDSEVPPAAGQALTLHVVTDASFPPFESLDPQSGEIVGFGIDLMNAIAENAGFEVEYENLPWTKLVESMNSCQKDIYISAMPVRQVSTEAKTVCYEMYLSTSFNTLEHLYSSCVQITNPLTFSQSYYQDKGIVMLVNSDNTDILSAKDLGAKKVAALIGTSADEFLQNLQAEPMLSDDPAFAVQLLLNRKVDAFIIDYRTALKYVEENDGYLKITGKPLTELAYAIGVCEYGSQKALLEKINTAMDALRADGTLDELEEKWMK